MKLRVEGEMGEEVRMNSIKRISFRLSVDVGRERGRERERGEN